MRLVNKWVNQLKSGICKDSIYKRNTCYELSIAPANNLQQRVSCSSQTLQPNNARPDMSCGRSHTSDKLPLIWTELPQNAQAHSSQVDNVMQVEKNGSSKYEQDQKKETALVHLFYQQRTMSSMCVGSAGHTRR